MRPYLAVSCSTSLQFLTVRKAEQQFPVSSGDQGLQMSSRCGRDLKLWEVLAGGLQPGAFLVASCIGHIALNSHFACRPLGKM